MDSLNNITLTQNEQILSNVAMQLGKGTEWGLDITLQRVIAEAATGAGIGLIFAAISAMIMYFVYRKWRKYLEDGDKILLVIIAGVAVFIFVSSIITIRDNVVKLLAPDYAAIETIVNLVKGQHDTCNQ